MQSIYHTSRLTLTKINSTHAAFMLELVNMPEWIRFIGDRKVKTLDDADHYIQSILENPTINYWVVSEKESGSLVGIVSFIKRHYLDHHDIGFALLRYHTKKGYAYEAAQTILQAAADSGSHSEILATTLRDNLTSIDLLHKLGFTFDKEIINESETLNVFSKKLISSNEVSHKQKLSPV